MLNDHCHRVTTQLQLLLSWVRLFLPIVSVGGFLGLK